MGTCRIDEEIDGLLLERAQDKAVVSGNDFVLVGLATILALIEQHAGAWPDVLTLMAFAARTLAHEIAAMLTEIIAPWI
jgi:hypothetical protein